MRGRSKSVKGPSRISLRSSGLRAQSMIEPKAGPTAGSGVTRWCLAASFDHVLRMILSENRTPLFGIMRGGGESSSWFSNLGRTASREGIFCVVRAALVAARWRACRYTGGHPRGVPLRFATTRAHVRRENVFAYYVAHLRIAGCGGVAASRRSSSSRRNMPVWVSICPTTEAELIVAARSASSMGFPSIT